MSILKIVSRCVRKGRRMCTDNPTFLALVNLVVCILPDKILGFSWRLRYMAAHSLGLVFYSVIILLYYYDVAMNPRFVHGHSVLFFEFYYWISN